jgi:hypothetical protein
MLYVTTILTPAAIKSIIGKASSDFLEIVYFLLP